MRCLAHLRMASVRTKPLAEASWLLRSHLALDGNTFARLREKLTRRLQSNPCHRHRTALANPFSATGVLPDMVTLRKSIPWSAAILQSCCEVSGYTVLISMTRELRCAFANIPSGP